MRSSMSEDGLAVGFAEDTPVMVRYRVRLSKSGATGPTGCRPQAGSAAAPVTRGADVARLTPGISRPSASNRC